jgi:hypothetical protein
VTESVKTRSAPNTSYAIVNSMDGPTLLLAALVLAPIAVLLFFRINAALVFLSLCLGNVLVQFTFRDTVNFLIAHANQLPAQASSASDNAIKLVLLLLPAVLTAIFMIRSIHGRGKQLLNILPAAGVGLLGAFLVAPLISNSLSRNMLNSSLWHQVNNTQGPIVGASAVVCLIILWTMRTKSGSKHSKKHKS